MSHLTDLIDEYRERRGNPSDASIARAIGVAPQTLSSWRRRGIRELPDFDTLERLARFLGVDYEETVFRAAAKDIGYLPEEAPTHPTPPADTSEGTNLA